MTFWKGCFLFCKNWKWKKSQEFYNDFWNNFLRELFVFLALIFNNLNHLLFRYYTDDDYESLEEDPNLVVLDDEDPRGKKSY